MWSQLAETGDMHKPYCMDIFKNCCPACSVANIDCYKCPVDVWRNKNIEDVPNKDWCLKMRNVSLMIITVWLMTSLAACSSKPVMVKPTCVKPVLKVSTIETDRGILNVLNELTVIIEAQESALECYERSFK